MLGSATRKMILAVLLTLMLATGAGCTEWLVASTAGSFSLGYFLGAGSASGQTTCYRNGEPIDCSAVPANLQP